MWKRKKEQWKEREEEERGFLIKIRKHQDRQKGEARKRKGKDDEG